MRHVIDGAEYVTDAVTGSHRDPRLDVGKIALQKQVLPAPVEQLTFTIETISSKGPGGLIAMSWETTRVFAPFTVVK